MSEKNAFENTAAASETLTVATTLQETGESFVWSVPVKDYARASGVQITFLVNPLSAVRTDAAFYADVDAAVKLALEDRQILIYRNGDLRLHFDPFDGFYKNSQAMQELIDRGFTDSDYRKLMEDGFSENESWFEIVPMLPNETELDALPDIEGNIPDALQSAIACLMDDEFWKETLAGYQPETEDTVMVECGNCGDDFAEGCGYKYDLFCSGHCYLRHYGEECLSPCAECQDDLTATPLAEANVSGDEAVLPVFDSERFSDSLTVYTGSLN